MENQNQNIKRSNQGRSVKVENMQRSSAVALGAMIATTVAAIWILNYLISTVYGSAYIGTPLIDYVNGREYGNAFDDASTLTVCFLRFILAFGFVWPMATMVVAMQQFISRKLNY